MLEGVDTEMDPGDAPASTHRQPLRVLIVEDSPAMLAALAHWVSSHADLRVVGTASTASEALSLVVRERPDVVTMDVALPGVNGLSATRTIKTLLPSTRVVVVTLNDGAAARSAAFAAGADAFLNKSSVADQLHAILVAGRAKGGPPTADGG
jgi:DNA-binding NarL/FixJ family response regulator